MTRRRLLKVGLVGGAAIAVGGGLLRWLRFGYAPQLAPGEKPVAFTVKEFAIAKAAVEAMLPAEDGLPSGLSLGIPQQLDEQVWTAHASLRADFKNGLQLLEHSTLLHGQSSRFTGLPLNERRAYLDGLMNGPDSVLAQVAFGLKEMIHLRYYGHPAVWQTIGYDGPLLPKAVPPDSSVAYAELLAKENR